MSDQNPYNPYPSQNNPAGDPNQYPPTQYQPPAENYQPGYQPPAGANYQPQYPQQPSGANYQPQYPQQPVENYPPQYPQQQYPGTYPNMQPPVQGYYPPQQASDSRGGMAIAGLVLGIISMFAWFIACIGLFVAIAGIVFSAIGRKSIQRKTMATWGLVLSIIGLVLSLGNAILGIILAMHR